MVLINPSRDKNEYVLLLKYGVLTVLTPPLFSSLFSILCISNCKVNVEILLLST